jgi:Tol biopolymer transport system component
MEGKYVKRDRLLLVISLIVLLGVAISAPACVLGPKVVSMAPGAAATAVPVDSALVLTFDQPMAPGSIEAALRLAPSPTEGLQITASTDGKSYSVQSRLPLQPGTTYQVTLSPAATSASGKSLRREWTASFTTASGRSVRCLRPTYSPDGLMIAWTEGALDAAAWSAYVAQADGQSPPRKVAASIWPSTEAVWSPDGQSLLVNVINGGGDGTKRPALAMVPVSGAGGGLPAQPIVLDLNRELSSPSRLHAEYSPDGAMLAVQNDMYMADAHSDILRVLGLANADGTGWRQSGNLLFGWLADGTGLLYLDMQGPGESHSFDYDLYRYSLATGTSTRVTAVGKVHNFGQADRAPDGMTFAFSTWRAEEIASPEGLSIERLPNDIWLLDVSLTGMTRLTRADQGHNGDVAFTPAGGLLLASDRATATGWDVWSLPSLAQAGGDAHNLTRRPGYDGQPRSALTGERIVFVSDASGAHEVWTMAADGTGWRLISGR